MTLADRQEHLQFNQAQRDAFAADLATHLALDSAGSVAMNRCQAIRLSEWAARPTFTLNLQPQTSW